MQKRAIILAAVLSALGVAGAASDAAEEPREHESLEAWWEAHRDAWRLEREPTRVQHLSFLVPRDATYALRADWETGEARVEILPEPPAMGGAGTGGCVTQYGPDTRAPWAVPGVGLDDQCTATEIAGPITSTTHIADTDGSSSMTSASYRPNPFSIESFLLVCENTAIEAVAWPDALVAQHCTVYQWGLPPTAWPSYRGNCGLSFGASEGVTACVHRS